MAVQGATVSGSELSPSVQAAFGWARAATPADHSIGSIAILFGIISAHRGSSEPDVLLEYVGRSREDLLAAMRRAAPGLDLDVSGPASEPPEFDDDGQRVVREALDLARRYDPYQDGRVHVPHLSGAVLMDHENRPAGRVLRTVLGDARANASRDYPLFLEELVSDSSVSYADFLDRHPALEPDRPPAPVEPFIGRQKELSGIPQMLGRGKVAVISGPRGSGKTALAIRVASDLGRPFVYVDGKRTGAERTARQTLARSSEALLVLDDADRPEFDEFLQPSAPAIVTTSRPIEPARGRFVLAPVNKREMQILLRDRVPESVSDADLERLAQLAAGLPGSAEQIGELLASGLSAPDLLAETGSLLAAMEPKTTAPEWKRFEARYFESPPHEQAVLRAAGLFDGRFSTPQAARVAETTDRFATNALTELTNRRLVESGEEDWSLSDAARGFARSMFGDRPEHERVRAVLNAIAARHGFMAPTDEPAALAGLRSDQPSTKDHIGFTPDVQALCKVLIAKEVHPPISVGLFGEWGTGKSTFMRLMRDEIRGLQAKWGGRDDSPFCKSVKQITFNAWNYSDANLWASLVTRIFEGLAGADPEVDRDSQLESKHRAAIVKALKTAELTIAEKEAERVEAREREAELEQRSKELATDEENAGKRLSEISPAKLMAEARESESVQALGKDFLQTAGVAGTADAVAVARDLRSNWGFAAHAAGMLGRTKTIALIVLTLAVLGGAGAAEALGVPVFGTIASIAVWLGGIATLARGPVGQARKAAAAADELLENLREEEQAAVRREEAAVHRELAQLAAQRAQLDSDLEQARATAARAQREINDIESGRRLAQFVEERAASAEYRQYLGLIALIRRDFDELSSLLLSNQADKPPFDRIILYIDDLDRCRAELVVQVLEAVHLLLALELFVVVVGVDPRWLHESLKHHYIGQLGLEDGAEPSSMVDEWSTTPQNYLEKIFQIPFALRPMDKAGFSKMMGELFELRPAATRSEASAVPRVQQTEIPDGTGGDADGHGTPHNGHETVTPASAERTLEMLRLWPAERAFLQRLGDLSPTPRAANRLANTYRLIRVSQDAGGNTGFVLREGRAGDYQVALLVLAIVVGFSDIANDVLDRLVHGKHQTFWTFVNALQAPPDSSPRTAATYARLREGLKTMKDPGLPDSIAPYRAWAPRVARYSFETTRRT
jgi:KAP family P-loop domain/ATPase family associated with various cellular activities (AAA)